MATDIIINLERLVCRRESDGTGHSEPYIWPVLIQIDDLTLGTPQLVRVMGPIIGHARVSLKNDMRAGDTADIPYPLGFRGARFEDGLTLRRLILAVALWEWDETPLKAVEAGMRAFEDELGAAIAEKLFELSAATPEEEAVLVESIETRVRDRVRSAIRGALTSWQKAKVAAGILNLDDIVGSAFLRLGTTESAPIFMSFGDGRSELYEIHGDLLARPVIVDPCQSQINAVNAARAGIDAVLGAIRHLQSELGTASPAAKAFIIREIRRLRDEDLERAELVLARARHRLRLCRIAIVPGADAGVLAEADSEPSAPTIGCPEPAMP